MILLRSLALLLRPKQYAKQIFVLLPCLTLGIELGISEFRNTALAVASFSLLSSSVYIFNDIRDLPMDILHPYKRFRPLASGLISIKAAIGALCFCLSSSLLLVLFISHARTRLFLLLMIYLAINILYSFFRLKEYNLMGMTCVALGFPIRFTFGTFAIGADFSYWAFLLSFSLAIFLLTGKRIQQAQFSDSSSTQNSNHFNLAIFGALFLAEYIGFILQPETQSSWGNQVLFLTPIPASLIVARYFELVMKSKLIDNVDITESFYKDLFLLVVTTVWIVLMFLANSPS